MKRFLIFIFCLNFISLTIQAEILLNNDEIKITSPYPLETAANRNRIAYLPIQVANKTDEELILSIYTGNYSNSKSQSAQNLTIPAKAIISKNLLLPVVEHYSIYFETNRKTTSSIYFRKYSSYFLEENLPKDIRSNSTRNPENLDPDWRVISGFSSIFLSVEKALSLPQSKIEILKNYVDFGGNLVLISKEKNYPSENSPEILAKNRFVSNTSPKKEVKPNLSAEFAWNDIYSANLGNVFLIGLKNKTQHELDYTDLNETIEVLTQKTPLSTHTPSQTTNKNINNLYMDFWPHGFHFCEPFIEHSNIILTIGIITLIVFCLFVGPINFFVLAPKNKRANLLVTTPIITFTFSIILCLLILILDQIGGKGEACLWVNCEKNKHLITQYQASYQGLMFENGIKIPEIAMINHYNKNFIKLNNSGLALNENSLIGTGDWFPSRTISKYRIQASQINRENVTISDENGQFSVSSTFSKPLNLFLYSPDGKSWLMAKNIEPGKLTRLLPADKEIFQAFEKNYFATCPTEFLHQKPDLGKITEAGRWMALLPDATPIPTNSDIEWNAKAIYTGILP